MAENGNHSRLTALAAGAIISLGLAMSAGAALAQDVVRAFDGDWAGKVSPDCGGSGTISMIVKDGELFGTIPVRGSPGGRGNGVHHITGQVDREGRFSDAGFTGPYSYQFKGELGTSSGSAAFQGRHCQGRLNFSR